ncbi:MAG TPA: NAD(P)/FAD-dependent oxidoreductase [Terriglobia bacterium]|nr:NAD(P)/FAD-dependent oxidoreductase [Terriglobia bacterium]
MKADVIVVGAGAAGLMCAIEAGRRRRTVIVLERNAAIGEKIRISGGGRCNFTNLHTRPDNFISENPSFAKSALSRYSPEAFIQLVEHHRIRWHEKKAGQLFCDGSSREILAMLRKECAMAGVKIVAECRVQSVRKGFVVETNQGVLECDSLVIATGGLSIPKIGATDFGYRIAKQFGLRVTTLRPGLVPLLFDEPKELHALHGVSFEADVRCGRIRFQESVLLTHRGLSGPGILQISSYWKPGDAISIRAVGHKPRRLAQAWKDDLWTLTPSGTEGYAKAEVTAGGIDTDELSSSTMESKKVPGLYFIGEVVDVTGQLGGFNFQWAWASGFAAGQNA